MPSDRRWSGADRELEERAAAAVHQAYLNTCARLGWPVKPANQVPYDELSEESKELDRASVCAVRDALTAAGKLRTGDPAATFEQFWADLVTTDGQLDPAKVRAELHDYYLVMGEVSKVYMELTDGRISKPNTLAHHVIGEANEASERAVREQVAEEIAQSIEATARTSYQTRGPAYRDAAAVARAHRTTPTEEPS